MTTMTVETKQYQPAGWNLSELLPEPSEAVIAERLAALEETVQEFVANRAKLKPEMDPDVFLAMLHQYEALIERIYVLGAFGQLWFSENTQSDEALTYRNRMQQVLTEIQNRTLFFDLWWKELDDAQADLSKPFWNDET